VLEGTGPLIQASYITLLALHWCLNKFRLDLMTTTDISQKYAAKLSIVKSEM